VRIIKFRLHLAVNHIASIHFAGMIMEDSSLIAVSSPKSPEERRRQLESVAIAGEDIKALMAAAKVLVRLG